MKKITFLFGILTMSFGFSQELVTNGDFQTGASAPWYGNAANVVDLGGSNFVNQAEVTSAGNAFAVNLSQDILLDNGKTYDLSFDAFTDATTGTRTMIVGLGQNNAPWSALTQTPTLTDTPQTFTYQFTINYGDGVGDRVLFDMGAATGFVFIDNVSVQEIVNTCTNGIQDGDETGIDCGGSCPNACVTPPATAAPTPPARATADVFSIYSDAYTDFTVDNFDAGWCGGAHSSVVMIAGNATLKKNTGIACQGIDFASNKQDLSSFTHLHFDFYIADTDLTGDVFNFKLVDFGGGGAENSALEVNINGGTNPQLVANTWVSVDVDITSIGGVVAGNTTRTDIAQMGITTANVDNLWFDNIYLHKNTTLSTEDFDKLSFTTYPNPTKDSWTLKSKDLNITSINVFDVLGKNVLSLKPDATEVKMDASYLKSGIYFAKIDTANGSSTLKLVKQ